MEKLSLGPMSELSLGEQQVMTKFRRINLEVTTDNEVTIDEDNKEKEEWEKISSMPPGQLSMALQSLFTIT